METALSFDIDSVLLELQRASFENCSELIPAINPPNNNKNIITRQIHRLLTLIKQSTQENEPLIIKYGEADDSGKEIYYENVTLFRAQTAVDNAVNKICQIINAPQWDLGLLATSKGLVYGPLTIILKSGEQVDCSSQQGGVLIPQDLPHGAVYTSTAKLCLIVEKDAAFQAIISRELNPPLDSCIFITGKGYPDMNTRFFVKDLSIQLMLPTFALVDGDPHGIDIFFNYKYGSMSKIHMNQHLAANSILWLGIHPTDIVHLVPSALQPLTNLDLNKARSLLKRPYVKDNAHLKHQITMLLGQKRKCEIENVSSICWNYLTDVYIPTKISRKKFIS